MFLFFVLCTMKFADEIVGNFMDFVLEFLYNVFLCYAIMFLGQKLLAHNQNQQNHGVIRIQPYMQNSTACKF
jgi:hypothetical protein